MLCHLGDAPPAWAQFKFKNIIHLKFILFPGLQTGIPMLITENHTTGYTKFRQLSATVRLPLQGSIDLTYRCNNNCRHCWVAEPDTRALCDRELSTDEWFDIIDQARALGTREWMISGGEPLLRPDFSEIVAYLKKKSTFLSVFSNGTLITPSITRLLRGSDLQISLYGATSEVFDHITRRPSSFERTMAGIACLREHGIEFTIRAFPMKDNFHQWPQMLNMAKELADTVRIGAAWLYLSAQGVAEKNREIAAQRLTPQQVIEVDPPNVCYDERMDSQNSCRLDCSNDYLFDRCIATRRDFHINPYGRMSFCQSVVDPSMRFDVKAYTLKEIWNHKLPALAHTVRGGQRYLSRCGSCKYRKECHWCSVYSYLEHRQHGKPVTYLCRIAKETVKYKEKWKCDHRRYFEIAGISIQVDHECSFNEIGFGPRFEPFKRQAPGRDRIRMEHHLGLPDFSSREWGEKILDRAPWRVYRHENGWIYILFYRDETGEKWTHLTTFSRDYRYVKIYNNPEVYKPGPYYDSLATMPTDQMWLAHVLSHRQAFYLHSSAMLVDGRGIMFVGPSDAGKSTTLKMFNDTEDILCDDRNIVRKWNDTWHVHGTWSHGEIPTVSDKSAPLAAIFFLEQSRSNRLIPVDDLAQRKQRLLPRLIRPVRIPEWWQVTLPLVTDLARSVPCYRMQFTKSGKIVPLIKALLGHQAIMNGQKKSKSFSHAAR
jgi:radical SAM protein with 4Fe4S-binding SPASM domain